MTDGLRKGLASYGDAGFSLFLRKAFIKAMGYSDDALDRPIVGITNTYSDYNPCHGNVPQIIEAVKRGADVNHRNENNVSALDWAKRGNEAAMAAVLRRAGAKD